MGDVNQDKGYGGEVARRVPGRLKQQVLLFLC